MKIKNPNFCLSKNNIFDIRKKEFEDIEKNVSKILKVVTKVGYKVEDLHIEDVPINENDLMPTHKNKLLIKLEKTDEKSKRYKKINLSLFIPKLHNNGFVIYGRRKIPEFQLFDIPKITKEKEIKISTNIWQFKIKIERKKCVLNIINLNKKISFAIFLIAYFGFEEVKSKIEDLKKCKSNNFIECLIPELEYELSLNLSQKEIIKKMGSQLSSFPDSEARANDFLFYISIINEIDIFSAKFFVHDNIPDELLYAVKKYDKKDNSYLDVRNKRIRCSEYFLYSNIIKIVFNFCMSAKRKKNYRINSTDILQKCGVSDVVQFDFSVNPLEELTKLSTVSLRGPGGFTKDNVPKELRDIHESMKGRLCPVDTPDRENCGIVNRLVPNVILDKNLRFSKEKREIDIISTSCSMIPFLEHDDPTRLQMASSQMRQSILISENEKPLIASGCEDLYTDKTKFITKAKEGGKVLFKNNEKLVIRYNSNEIETFKLGLVKLYVGNCDIVKSKYGIGDEFKKNDIILNSEFCKEDFISIGSNLLTGIMPYKGYNYEDGIIIREGITNKLKVRNVKDLSFTITKNKILLNLNSDPNNYKPIPEVGDILEVGDAYASI